MPSLRRAGRDRGAGPTPFTTQWINEPPEPPRPRRVGASAVSLPDSLPSWLPSERLLAALIVLGLVCSTVLAAGGGDRSLKIAASPDEPPPESAGLAVGGASHDPALTAEAEEADDGEAQTAAGVPENITSGSSGDGEEPSTEDEPAATEEPSVAPTPTVVPAAASLKLEQPTAPPADGSILPYYRIVSYYGQPHDSNMGILGEYAVEDDIEGLHAALAEQAAEYELADPTRPVKLAFEVIATVAQGSEMSDGSWLLSTDEPTIQEFVDYAAEHDMLVILDVQIGRRGVPDEIERIRHWLEYPHVHLALDPEFAMDEGEIPGEHIGQIDAADIRYAQEYLADLSAELGLPPKVLIVHQFHYTMINNKDQVAPYPGVQLVIDMDGHGPPEMKLETYAVMNTQHPIEFNGVKLFYQFDVPVLSAAEVLALQPIPDLIIYQ